MSVLAAMASAISPSNSAERKPRHQAGSGQSAAAAGSAAFRRSGRAMPEEVAGGARAGAAGKQRNGAEQRGPARTGESHGVPIVPAAARRRSAPARRGDRLHGVHHGAGKGVVECGPAPRPFGQGFARPVDRRARAPWPRPPPGPRRAARRARRHSCPARHRGRRGILAGPWPAAPPRSGSAPCGRGRGRDAPAPGPGERAGPAAIWTTTREAPNCRPSRARTGRPVGRRAGPPRSARSAAAPAGRRWRGAAARLSHQRAGRHRGERTPTGRPRRAQQGAQPAARGPAGPGAGLRAIYARARGPRPRRRHRAPGPQGGKPSRRRALPPRLSNARASTEDREQRAAAAGRPGPATPVQAPWVSSRRTNQQASWRHQSSAASRRHGAAGLPDAAFRDIEGPRPPRRR